MISPDFRHPLRVYWEDTDAGGVVFFANYLKFFERARTEWLRAQGFGQERLRTDTGAIFVRERAAIVEASQALRDAAGNFYINDKPTGALVGQQPFGGARASGTNDKAGSLWNLVRWVSPRTIKETFAPPVDWRYPHMQEP